MKYKIIYVITVLIMLNIVFVPFICNRFWSLETEHGRRQAIYFSDMIEDLSDSNSSDDDVPIHGVYYLGGLACTLFIFINALRKNSGTCAFGSLLGIGLSLYLLYQVHLGPGWYVCGNDAQLTFGFYISCVGFISMLIASLVEEKE